MRRRKLQEMRKRTTHNAKVAAAAAKALGPLSTAESALTKLLAKAEGKEGIDAAAEKLCQEKLVTVTAWSQQCRRAVNEQERNKNLSAQDAAERLEDLPFESGGLEGNLKANHGKPKGVEKLFAQEGCGPQGKSS